jgi:hypothetical protein
LATARDQAFLTGTVGMFIANSVEDCALIRKEGAKPVDHQVLEIGGRDASSL